MAAPILAAKVPAALRLSDGPGPVGGKSAGVVEAFEVGAVRLRSL